MLFLTLFLGVNGALDFRVELGDGHVFTEHGVPLLVQDGVIGKAGIVPQTPGRRT